MGQEVKDSWFYQTTSKYTTWTDSVAEIQTDLNIIQSAGNISQLWFYNGRRVTFKNIWSPCNRNKDKHIVFGLYCKNSQSNPAESTTLLLLKLKSLSVFAVLWYSKPVPRDIHLVCKSIVYFAKHIKYAQHNQLHTCVVISGLLNSADLCPLWSILKYLLCFHWGGEWFRGWGLFGMLSCIMSIPLPCGETTAERKEKREFRMHSRTN